MARLQSEQVHTRAIYDIEVDTSVPSPEECAAIIADYLNSARHPMAFEKLRESVRSHKDTDLTPPVS